MQTSEELQRWKRAVVHIECAADSETLVERRARLDAFFEATQKSDEPIAAIYAEFDRPGRDLRYSGTAVYVADDDGEYLVTERHVVHDVDLATSDFEGWHGPNLQLAPIAAARDEHISNWIFPIVFRVPSLDDALAGLVAVGESLMNLSAGTSFSVPYLYDVGRDLAVIDLDKTRGTSFGRFLRERGHEPVAVGDIAGPPVEGDEVFTVGFPEATSVMGELDLSPAEQHWASATVALPVFSYGRVAMVHDALDFFWADMTVYPGNSGGPVVADGRLVGIVSGQPWITVEENDDLEVRIPFTRAYQVDLVPSMIEELKERRDWRLRRFSPRPGGDLGS